MIKLTREQKVQEQIERATEVIKKHGYTTAAYVGATRYKPRGKESFGFNFNVAFLGIGDRVVNEDGSIFTVEAIVKSN